MAQVNYSLTPDQLFILGTKWDKISDALYQAILDTNLFHKDVSKIIAGMVTRDGPGQRARLMVSVDSYADDLCARFHEEDPVNVMFAFWRECEDALDTADVAIWTGDYCFRQDDPDQEHTDHKELEYPVIRPRGPWNHGPQGFS